MTTLFSSSILSKQSRYTLFFFLFSSTSTWLLCRTPHYIFTSRSNGFEDNIYSKQPLENYSSDPFLDSDSTCDVWSTRATLLPSSRTKIFHSVQSQNMIHTQWRHQRCGHSTASGYEYAYVTQCLPSINNEYFSNASLTLLKRGNDKLQFEKDILRCGDSSKLKSLDQSKNQGTTIALLLPHSGGYAADELPTSKQGPNLWHFHASAFRFWLALRLPYAISLAHKLNIRNISTPDEHINGVDSNRLEPPETSTASHVLLLLPHGPCIAANLPFVSFEVTPTSLKGQLERGASRPALESLQGLADSLGPRVIAVCQKRVGAVQIVNELHEANYPPVRAVVIPPPGGFLWDFPGDPTLEPRVRKAKCKNSLLQQYANDFQAMGRQSRPWTDQKDDDMKHKQQQQQVDNGPDKPIQDDGPSLARHVCFVSRQERSRPNGSDRGKLRNLEAGFMRQFMLRLAAPVVLSPSLSLRGESDPLVPSHINHASLSGQLRYVHDECAVLLGVHGAGLTNALGLRRGTALIELVTGGKSYHYFRNIVALLDDTSYDVFEVNGKKFEDEHYFRGDEVDLHLDDAGLETLVELVQRRLEESLEWQTELRENTDLALKGPNKEWAGG